MLPKKSEICLEKYLFCWKGDKNAMQGKEESQQDVPSSIHSLNNYWKNIF